MIASAGPNERFAREQVDGNGVAGEGVHGHQIVLLAGLAFEREARVAQQNLMIALRNRGGT